MKLQRPLAGSPGKPPRPTKPLLPTVSRTQGSTIGIFSESADKASTTLPISPDWKKDVFKQVKLQPIIIKSKKTIVVTVLNRHFKHNSIRFGHGSADTKKADSHRGVRLCPSAVSRHSSTNFACTPYSSLIVLNSSGSSSAALSASAAAFALRISTALSYMTGSTLLFES